MTSRAPVPGKGHVDPQRDSGQSETEFAAALTVGAAAVQDPTSFRIGTGGAGGTYFPIAGTIANRMSAPPATRPCDKGGQCGVTGLIAIAQSTTASVFNNAAVQNGELEA